MLGLRRFLSGLMAAGDALHQLADTLHEARVTLQDRLTACRPGDDPRLMDCTPAPVEADVWKKVAGAAAGTPTDVLTPAAKHARRKS